MGLENYANPFWALSDPGCEVWANSTSDLQWKQIEKIQKHMITSKFKIKSSVPYEIMLSEIGVASIEAISMVRLIRYLKRVEVEHGGNCLITSH